MKTWFIPGLIITGALLIVIALVIPNRSIDTINKNTVGIVIDFTGTSHIEGLDLTDTALVQKKTKIKNLDIIQTKSLSTVNLILTESKSEVKILENSSVLFEQNSENSIVLTIKEGDINIENLGEKSEDPQTTRFWIKKDGRQLSGLDYAITNDRSNTQKNKIFSDEIKNNPGILSQSKIEEILNNKKNDFFRCYGQLIQKDEQAHGQILLSFEILNTGKVSKVDFSKTELNQASFLSCLKEVVQRTQFPTFSGKAITTVFPLKFE